MAVNYIPKGYQHVIPYLAVSGAAKIIPFAEKVLGGQVIYKMEMPDGAVAHAEIRIRDTVVMIGTPEQGPGTPGMLMVYLPDVDDAFRRAIAAGATAVKEPADQFYGDRTAMVKDACGNQWYLATHKEDVSPQEMDRRAAEYVKKQGAK